MHRSTLPRRARATAAGWAHPYPLDPFSPALYADGGEEEGEGEPGAARDTEGSQGAADDAGTDIGDADDEQDPAGAEALGDPGKKALATMKDKWRTERDKRRGLERQLAERPAADGGEEQPDTEAIQRQAEQAAAAKANTRIIRSEVRAAAAGRLADPKDALKFLDLDQFEVDDNGDVDADEVADAIEDLIKNKPYLAAQGGRRFQGTGDGGAARKATRPAQLTEADVKRLSAEGKHAEIVKARNEGRLDDYLGLTQ